MKNNKALSTEEQINYLKQAKEDKIKQIQSIDNEINKLEIKDKYLLFAGFKGIGKPRYYINNFDLNPNNYQSDFLSPWNIDNLTFTLKQIDQLLFDCAVFSNVLRSSIIPLEDLYYKSEFEDTVRLHELPKEDDNDGD